VLSALYVNARLIILPLFFLVEQGQELLFVRLVLSAVFGGSPQISRSTNNENAKASYVA
jgi:hypothetical protein